MGKPMPKNNKTINCRFWKCFLGVLEILSTDITQPARSLWFFLWKRLLRQLLVNCVERISRRKLKITKHLKKQNKHILIASQRYQNLRYILQNKKKCLFTRQFFSSPTHLIKNPRSTALWGVEFYHISSFSVSSQLDFF